MLSCLSIGRNIRSTRWTCVRQLQPWVDAELVETMPTALQLQASFPDVEFFEAYAALAGDGVVCSIAGLVLNREDILISWKFLAKAPHDEQYRQHHDAKG